MSTQIISFDITPVLIQAGYGIPNHVSTLGTEYTDLYTALKYVNKDGILGWVQMLDITYPFSGGSGTIFTGGTVTGPTYFLDGITANTISATTYYNLPLDIYVTGSSLNVATYDLTLTRNDGVSIISNLGLLASDMTVTGGTYNINTGVVTFTNNSGGTFNVTGFTSGMTDTYTTGGTVNNGVATFTKTNGGTYSVSGFATTFTGGTVSGATNFIGGLTANTISATTITGTNLYVTGSTQSLFSGSSSVEMVKIIQNGSGDAFVVEDITNGDPSHFVINASGNTAIGLTQPLGNDKLTVSGDTSIYGAFKATSITANTALFSASTQNILKVIGSGNSTSLPIFTVQGSQGELFSVSDSLIGSLFSVNDISGLPVIEAFSDNTVLMGSYLAPSLNTTVKIVATTGSTNIYSIPISAYTGAFFDYTINDGTNLRGGNIMSIWSGSTIQYTETSTNDIGNTSGLTFNMIISGSSAILKTSGTTGSWTVKTIVRSI
jgi:hypothetical protein